MKVIFGVVSVGWFVVTATMTGGLVPLLFDDSTAKPVAGGILVGMLLVYCVFAVVALTPVPLLIDVGSAGITLDEGRRGVFPAATARLGVWQLPLYGVAAGTAVHLGGGGATFCLGGRDHRPSPALRLDVAPVQEVDAFVTAAELDAVLAVLHASGAPAVPSLGPPPTVVRCALAPNRATLRGGFAGTPTVELFLDLYPEGLRIVHARTGALVAEAPLGQVRAFPARHTYSGRPSFTMPLLMLVFPGPVAFTVGIPDYRFAWLGEAHEQAPAPHVVGGPDWLALVERMGLTARLTVGKDV